MNTHRALINVTVSTRLINICELVRLDLLRIDLHPIDVDVLCPRECACNHIQQTVQICYSVGIFVLKRGRIPVLTKEKRYDRVAVAGLERELLEMAHGARATLLFVVASAPTRLRVIFNGHTMR